VNKDDTGQSPEPSYEPSTEPSLYPLVDIPDPIYPLAKCQGNCRDNDDCQGSLVCYERDGFESVPNCLGEGTLGQNYCCDRPLDFLLWVDREPNEPLNACEADCDDDTDCTGNLICYQRDGSEEVPGCRGDARYGWDYCRWPDSLPPSTSPSNSLDPTSTRRPSAISATPSLEPTASYTPTVDYYQYTNVGTQCEYLGELFQIPAPDNYQGPAPFTDKSNVALQFFAFGDTPYDNQCSDCNTCYAEDGTKEDDCTRFDCILKNITMDDLPLDNTCTYEGKDYMCVKESIIPYMNSRMDAGDAAFVLHAGDILKGGNVGESKRCTSYAYNSRKDLFNNATNFLVVPGDNDWNECYGYDLYSNTDPTRELWRATFSDVTSPFNQFRADFPGGGRPFIYRKSGNPEMFFFEHNAIAFFGLNRVSFKRISYISDIATVDLNAEWIEERLSLDIGTCSYESIVILAQALLKPIVYDKVDTYFEACGPLPLLTITGDYHPDTFCMTKNSTNTRLDLTVEAFRSGPLLVSVVRDPTGQKGDYFHVDDSDLVDSNSDCPTYF